MTLQELRERIDRADTVTEDELGAIESLSGVPLLDRVKPIYTKLGVAMYSAAEVRRLFDAGCILQTRER